MCINKNTENFHFFNLDMHSSKKDFQHCDLMLLKFETLYCNYLIITSKGG